MDLLLREQGQNLTMSRPSRRRMMKRRRRKERRKKRRRKRRKKRKKRRRKSRKGETERVPSAQSAPARSISLRTPIPRHRIGLDAWLCRMIFKVEEILITALGWAKGS